MGEINKVRLQVIVEGYVQGVGFRMFTRDIAKKMGLTGWVRNRTNGDVEIVAEGDRKDLNLFLRYLWKGPRSSVVTNVETKWGPYTGEFSEFVIAPSAY